MSAFSYRDGELCAEHVPLAKIAEEFGTPAFVYSHAEITANYAAFVEAFRSIDHEICYSVKANSNLGVLSLLASLGASFDIVSGGELHRVLLAGGDPARVVFSGVGKQRAEMVEALRAGIHCFNLESRTELLTLNEVAGSLNLVAPISIRVNPDVDPKTHPYIATGLSKSKFGISTDAALAVYEEAATLKNIRIKGIDSHIGSQITTLGPYLDAFSRVLALVDNLQKRGIAISHIDIGGGMGVRYKDETPLDIDALASGLRQLRGSRTLKLLLEPGRSIVARAGVLLCRVNVIKTNGTRQFAIVDAAMNDLIRPALYQAWQDVLPVTEPRSKPLQTFDIVGPVCESGDFLALDRQIDLHEGELLAIDGCGAYGFAMSSNYNSRNRCPEIIVEGARCHLVRARETYEDQIRLERRLPGRPDESLESLESLAITVPTRNLVEQ